MEHAGREAARACCMHVNDMHARGAPRAFGLRVAAAWLSKPSPYLFPLPSRQCRHTCAPPPVGGTGRRHAFSGASLRFTVLRSHGVGKARPPSIGPRVGSQHNKKGEKKAIDHIHGEFIVLATRAYIVLPPFLFISRSIVQNCTIQRLIKRNGGSTPLLTCSRRLVRPCVSLFDACVSWAARSIFFPFLWTRRTALCISGFRVAHTPILP
jgi:hypothetical protein